MRSRRIFVALAVACVATATVSPVRSSTPTATSEYDWPTYGHDLHRSFHTRTTLDGMSVRMLEPVWFFQTGDAVTANPVIVNGTMYVGSWDGCFYALDTKTGSKKWAFPVDLDQPAIVPRPQPGPCPRQVDRQLEDLVADGGYITSTALFVPARGRRQAMVIFGGGGTLYALRPADGSLVYKRKFTGRGEIPPSRTNAAHPFAADDFARIFSSPALVGNHVLFSVDEDGQPGYRGYLVSVNVSSGATQWLRELDVDAHGGLINDGCGNVWASPTIVDRLGLEVVGVADCHFSAPGPNNERILGVRIADGKIAWRYTPDRGVGTPDDPDPNCDFDFAATANYDPSNSFLGVGGKDGTYYRLDPRNGHLVWKRRVTFGGFAGGFLGSTAYDGTRVYGATAYGDFGRFESPGEFLCDPDAMQDSSTMDTPVQEPSMHALAAGDGSVVWQGVASHSYGPTVVATSETTGESMTFVGTFIPGEGIQIRDATNGLLLGTVPLQPSSSGIIVGENAIFFGMGPTPQGVPNGVWAYAPAGQSIQ